jgi:drug/metabolite transporter (DMT)-like permease
MTMSVLLQAVSGVLCKAAALGMGTPTAMGFLMSPWYLGGLASLALQAVCWQFVLREVRLFVAYLVTSLNYFVVLAASRIFFQETVPVSNIVGATIIVAGVYLVVREDLA